MTSIGIILCSCQITFLVRFISSYPLLCYIEHWSSELFMWSYSKTFFMCVHVQAFKAAWKAACLVPRATIELPSEFKFLVRPVTLQGPCMPHLVLQVLSLSYLLLWWWFSFFDLNTSKLLCWKTSAATYIFYELAESAKWLLPCLRRCFYLTLCGCASAFSCSLPHISQTAAIIYRSDCT